MPGAVTLLPDGRFVVVWTHDTGSYYVRDEIVAQIFNPNGTKSGPEFIVNTEYLLEQTDPKIATLTLSYAIATAGIHIDLHTSGFGRQDGGDGLDLLYGDIENLIGSAFDDALAGNDAANVLDGGAGDDEIWASGADDRLIGGAGNDFLSGSGYGVTTFVFGANSGDDLVTGFTPKATLPSYLAHDVIEIDPSVLANFAALMAAATEDEYGHTSIRLSDTSSIVLWSVSKASLSADDFLFVSPGWEGNDTLYSTSGNDTLNGGSGNDTASYAAAAAGVTVSLMMSGPQNTIGAGTDTLVSIENLTGSGIADTLFGDAWNNTLIGGSGNDRLTGQDGRDTLTGGAGNDLFVLNAVGESTANPVMCDVITDFGQGADRIDLSTIDANWFKGGNQSFRFVGMEEFSLRAGELRYETVDQPARPTTARSFTATSRATAPAISRSH